MRQLYTKVALSLLAAFVAIALVFRFVVVPADDAARQRHFERVTGSGLRWLAHELGSAPPSEWSARLEDAAGYFLYPLEIQSREELERRIGPLHRDGSFSSTPPKPPLVYLRIDEGEHYLVGGPLPAPPRTPVGPLLFMIAIILVASAFVVVPLTRRLRNLQRATLQIQAGDLSVRVDDSSRDVVGELTASLNSMAERLERMFREREELLLAVAHELRAPVSRIRVALELLADEVHGPDRAHHAEQIREDVKEMDSMVAELTAWVEADGLTSERAETGVHAETGDVVARAAGSTEKSVSLTCDGVSQSALIAVAPHLYRRVLDNVLRNALAFAAGEVKVAIAPAEDGAVVTVDDDGPGIPPAARERVLQPFVRVDDSRSRETGGMGLGLAIVARILERHHGSVVIQESPLGGARVRMQWPWVGDQVG